MSCHVEAHDAPAKKLLDGGHDPREMQARAVAARERKIAANLDSTREAQIAMLPEAVKEHRKLLHARSEQALGVSRQRVDQLSRGDGFPEPADLVGRNRLWRKAAVKRWADRSGWWEAYSWRRSRPEGNAG